MNIYVLIINLHSLLYFIAVQASSFIRNLIFYVQTRLYDLLNIINEGNADMG